MFISELSGPSPSPVPVIWFDNFFLMLFCFGLCLIIYQWWAENE